MKSAIIKLENINKIFGTQKVLDSVNIEISQGDFVVIMGESGSGKTTLINILAFLDFADSGTYTLLGNDVTNISISHRSKYRRDNMNIVFQKYNLFDELTIYENLVTYVKICELEIDNLDESIKQIANSVQLYSHLHKKVSVLSQGEKQRVAIARSLLTEKKLILADEPTASVDKDNRDIIIKLLLNANSNGNTVVVVTHDKEYLKYATRKLLISYGCVTEL